MSNHRNGLSDLGATHFRLIQVLRKVGSASRVELAASCGITPAAVSMMMQDLITRKIVVESGRRKGVRGAPQIDLTLSPDAGYALGIHADYHSVNLALLDFSGEIRGEKRIQNRFSSFDSVVAAVVEGTQAMLSAIDLPASVLIGAGCALPTRFTGNEVTLNLADEVIAWNGADIVTSLSTALGCDVIIENDANAAAMGELSVGNSAGYDNFAYLYLSSGIGGAIVIDGKLYRGMFGNAGEVGALRPRGLSRPSFDDLVVSLTTMGLAVPPGRDPQSWEAFLATVPDAVEQWLQRAGPEAAKLGFAISAILSPAAIYIGGSLPRSLRQRLGEWMDFSQRALFDGGIASQPQILLPEVTARDSVSVGAAAMMLHRYHRALV
jgi:predicted NBD/HSP70 family sugar kinase